MKRVKKKTYHLSFTEDGILKEYTSGNYSTGVAYKLTAKVLSILILSLRTLSLRNKILP